MKRDGMWIVGAVLAALVAACSTGPAGPVTPIAAIQATAELPPEAVLDVGIGILDPGLPEPGAEPPKDDPAAPVLPDVRESEARFIPVHLMRTLAETGHWGAVRVMPDPCGRVDLCVTGTILSSGGKNLELFVTARDATGRVWLAREYREVADTRAYQEEETGTVTVGEPFQNLYNRIANDLLEARDELTLTERARVRQVAQMRFAADLAPDAYADYLAKDRKGRTVLARLPAADDPMLVRLAHVKAQEDLLVDTLNEHYAALYTRMSGPYDQWRSYAYEEQVNFEVLRKKARTRKILGALALIGAVLIDPSDTASGLASDAALIGGIMAISSGIGLSAEAKIHVEALRELGQSFDSEMAPVVVEVEGKTLQLSGSAEAQFAAWRELLAEIWAAETGTEPNQDAGIASVELTSSSTP